MLIPRDYWIEDATSADNTAQNVDHAVPATQDPHLRYLYVESDDGSRVAFNLERPAGTVIFSGYSPYYADFGMDGFYVPGTEGDDVRLAVAAGAAGVATKAYMIGVDKPRSH